ncbi:MAG: putative baseplate assembly protein, partial [Anaerolineales bacterium]
DLASGTKLLYLKGTSTGLQTGDAILLVGEERERDPGSERWDFRFIKNLEVDTKNDRTVVTWTQGLGERPVLPAEEPRVYAFRLRAALFGHNAAEWDNLHADIKKLYPGGTDEWPNFKIVSDRIDLDASYPRVIPGGWIALVRPNYVEIYRVNEADLTSRTGFGLVSKVTRIYPDGTEHLEDFGLRETTVYAESQELELAEEPLPSELSGDELALQGWVPGLMEGRTLVISGKRLRARSSNPLSLWSADGLRRATIQRGDSLIVTAPPVSETDGTRWFLMNRDGFSGSVLVRRRFLKLEPPLDADPQVSEVASLSAVIDEQERTMLRLEEPLQNLYDRNTVTIYANVAQATHGETVGEVLGSGDGTQPNQRFTLKKPPLTYVSAATPSGVESTLTVRVNGVAWEEAASLYGLGARDQTYLVSIGDVDGGDGKTSITFGDGRSGARLPTGSENIQATYRSGIGLEGEVEAGSLTLLQTRPLGVRSVTNPLPASGAADPEERDQARQNAPITVLTLDRIVSLKDFEDFTRAFSGIGKAQTTAIWDGETNIVHITAATVGGDTLDPNSVLYTNLRQAVDEARDPYIPLVLQGYQPVFFRLSAKVLVDERYVKEAIFEAIEQAVLEAFSFEDRAFGQAVSAAEVITLLQGVEGVVACDLDSLYRDGESVALNTTMARSQGSCCRR